MYMYLYLSGMYVFILIPRYIYIQGIFQFDMWGVKPTDRWDWAGLREQILKHGIRNSLLLAPMPTASTAQILGKKLLDSFLLSCRGD